MTSPALVAVGGYSTSGSGRGTGIALLRVTPDDSGAAAETLWEVAAADPSFLLWSADGSLLHAVTETSPTHVLTLRVAEDGSSGEIIGDLELAGSGGCHLAPGTRPDTLLVANYGSGSVETVRLDAEGLPVELLDLDDHHDYAEDRDPHPHQVVRLPGTELIAVPDLGLDRVVLYRQVQTGHIEPAGEIPFSRGSGPRHLAADHESSQLLVSCELSGKVGVAVRGEVPQDVGALQVMRGPELEWSVRSMVPASGRPEESALSHVELAADEHHALVANRGPDTIALFSLAGMRPELVAEVSVGAHPRHFTQLGTTILVAAQEGDRIDVLRRHQDTLEVAGDPIPAPSVSCLAPRP